MPSLYGYRNLEPEALKKRVGRMSQIAGIRPLQLTDGRANGVRVLDFQTGSGLDFSVLVDRCMDLYSASFCGVPLAWHAMAGVVAPAYFEPEAAGWLRSWGAGLMTTCGLEQAGTACEDEGVAYGLHGRVGNLPAENVQVEESWEADEYLLKATGKVRQGFFVWDTYLLAREIRVVMGKPVIHVHDRVENTGYQAVPLELLYHVNLGFPLLDESARLLLPSRTVTPRDDIAAAGLESWDCISSPQEGFQEQVFEHQLAAGDDGWVTTALVNDRLLGGLGLYLRYKQSGLPFFTEWKQMGEGAYVLGLEPGNCHPHGRRAERERGTLEFLQPGETRDFHLEFGVVRGPDSIAELSVQNKQLRTA